MTEYRVNSSLGFPSGGVSFCRIVLRCDELGDVVHNAPNRKPVI